jgi:hypothetical protein
VPEEYVYKIVVDDSEVNTALDKIDRQVVTLTQKMDAMFRGVGAGAATGLQQASQQVEQAARRSGQAQTQAAQQASRANRQAAQETVRGIQQEIQARNQSLAVMDQEIQKARERVDAAQAASTAAQENLASARAGTTQPGGGRAIDLGAVSPAVSGAQAADAEVSAAQASLDQLVSQREAASQQIQAITEQEAQAVTAAAESSAQAVAATAERSSQATLEAARIQVQNARETVQSKKQEEQAFVAAASQAQAQADVAKAAEIDKSRAVQDAAERYKQAQAAQAQAAQEAASVSKDASEGEKAALDARKSARDQDVASAKAAVDAAKSEHTEAKRQSEDSTRDAKAAGKARVASSKQVRAAEKEQRLATTRLRKETSALARQTKLTAKDQKSAERLFIRTSKTFGKQRKELDELAKKYGSFTVTLGKNNDELDEHEKEVYDVIRSDKQLGREIDKLVNKFGRFDASVDRATFAGGPGVGIPRTQFRQAGFALGRAGVPGAATFGEAAAVGGVAGVAAVGVLLTVKQLIDAFQKLASIAADAFKKIIAGSIEAAKEIEVARAQFSAFFQQDTVAAEAALQRLQSLSVELGENVVGIGRAFLPEVESLDQLEEVVKIATALARFQPEQGILGARIALQEALAGEFRSLQRRFEISPVAIDKIREAMQAGGVTAGLDEIQAELERTGRSVEDLADTFSVSMGRVTERIRQVGQELGDPIIQELADQLDAVDEQLEELEPDLDVIASAFGEVFSRLVDIIGVEVADFLEDFDPEPVLEVASALNGVFEALALVSDILSTGSSAAYGFERVMDNLTSVLMGLEFFILSVGRDLAGLRNGLLDYLKIAQVVLTVAQALPVGGPLVGSAAKGYGAVALNEINALIEAIEGAGGVDPFNWDLALIRLEENKKEFELGIQDMVDSSEDMDAAGATLADRFLKIAQSLEELDTIQQQFAESQQKVNDAINEFNIQAALKFEKILTDARRARLEFEIQAAQKSLDIERKNAQKVADIRTKFNQDIIDAAQDLIDREADIARKNGRDMLDLEDEHNAKRLEAEQKYLDALEKLRDKFNFQAFEAILANDAKQLRQIRRRQAFEEGQLKKDKDRDLRDIDSDIEERRRKLDEALRRELEDARIANARKLRDLNDNLVQQLDKQEEARRRELEQQGIAEKRKRDELNNALSQQLEDYDTWWAERYRVTTEGIAADLEAMQGYVDTANGILGELGALGVGFDPVTGEAIVIRQDPAITTTESPELAELRNYLIDAQVYLENLSRRAGEPLAQRADVAEQFADFSLEELADEYLRLANTIPQFFNRVGLNPLIEDDLVDQQKDILRDQAVFLGAQVGFTEDQILGELPQSLDALREWVDEFIAAWSARDIPPFSLLGEEEDAVTSLVPGGPEFLAAQGVPPQEVLNMVETLQTRLISLWSEQFGAGVAPDERITLEEWQAGWETGIERLAESLSVNELIGALEVAQETAGLAEGDPGVISISELRDLMLQATPTEWQAQLFPGLFGDGAVPGAVPGVMPGEPPPGITGPDLLRYGQAVPGQTQFIFPGVTQTPYVIPEDFDFVPDFGQLMMAGGGQAGAFEGLFQPQAFIPGGPQVGFDLDAWNQQLNEQIQAQAIAELAKRGEISDTFALSELLAEKESLALAALLNEQTYDRQVASDEQIAIVEEALARQQAALAGFGDDTELEEEVKVVETAIGILETALEQMRADQAEANAALALEETMAVEAAEEDKVDAVVGTTTAVVDELRERGLELGYALDDEADSVQDAADEQVGIVEQQETDKAEIRDTSRAMELEANLEQAELRQEQEADAFAEETDILDAHFQDFLRREGTWLQNDIDLLQWWLLQRQILINQAVGQLPGLPGDGGGPSLPGGGGGGGTASLSELQSLAISLAEQLGILDQDTRNEIMTLEYGDLVAFIEWLQSQLPGYALGGGFGPGLAVVGEQGEAEIVRMGGAGRIDVFKDLLFRSTPAVGVGGVTHNDNSMNMGGFNIPDPRGMPLTYVRQVENIISNAIKQAWATKL